MPRRRAYDRWLFLTAALLALAGLFMVGSASHYIAMSAGRDPCGMGSFSPPDCSRSPARWSSPFAGSTTAAR